MKDNVVDFNKAFEKRKKRDEEIDALVRESEKEVAEIVSVVNARETVWALRHMGIEVENDPRAMLEILTIIEASKSLVFRSIGEEYPFQTFSNTVFEQVEKESGVEIHQMLEDFILEMENYFDEVDE